MRPALLAMALCVLSLSARAQEPPSSGIETALCGLIDGAARTHGVPPGFLTRLIFQESSFRAGAVSPVGAQGIAQFMPGTARERGLSDPFDPEQAIPKSAHLLADLRQQFGNWGLAAAAYNGGPTRVANWIAGRGGLPFETEAYVAAITGASAQDWADEARADRERDGRDRPPRPATRDAGSPCGATLVAIRGSGRLAAVFHEAPFAPWGVQLAGNFSKSRALAAFARARSQHRGIIGGMQPMVIGTRFRARGTRAFYRVRLPAASRAAAAALCQRIQLDRGACVVLKS